MGTPEWKVGNEFAPYHPSASHCSPDYRDGWNHCYQMAAARLAALEADARRKDAALRELLAATALFEDGLDEADGEEYDEASQALTRAEMIARAALSQEPAEGG